MLPAAEGLALQGGERTADVISSIIFKDAK